MAGAALLAAPSKVAMVDDVAGAVVLLAGVFVLAEVTAGVATA